MTQVKLFMLLLGCKPIGRHTEQHDVFFCIGENLKSLIPEIKAFWPEGDAKIHIDAWREVTAVDGFNIEVKPRGGIEDKAQQQKLFFINLGGYKEHLFDEPHYRVLSVQSDKANAIKNAKTTDFFRQVRFKGAESHIDDKYGVDVDDLYEIEEILPPSQKDKFQIQILPGNGNHTDEIHLGYFKLSNL